MSHDHLRKAVLWNFMWTFSFKLLNEFPCKSLQKIHSISLYRSRLFDLDASQQIKVRAWELLAEEFDGEVNMAVTMGMLYWAFPEVYGKSMQQWVDLLEDEIVSHLGMEHVGRTEEILNRYVELIDQAIEEYLDAIN